MLSKNELIQQLRSRRRSVQAEIERIQGEVAPDYIRAASNSGYMAALEVEASFLTGILSEGDPAER